MPRRVFTIRQALIADLAGTVNFPVSITPAQTLLTQMDAAGLASTATFNATAGSADSAVQPYVFVDLQQLIVTVPGQGVVTVTLHAADYPSAGIGAATAAEFAAALARDIPGVSVAVSGGNRARVTTDRRGSSASLSAWTGTAAAAAAFVNTAASGNVSDITAVTAAELKTIVELSNALANVNATANPPHLTSKVAGATSRVRVTGGTAATAMGFPAGSDVSGRAAITRRPGCVGGFPVLIR